MVLVDGPGSWPAEDPLISPKEAPESSWLEKERFWERPEELKEESVPVLIDLEELEDGEKDKGS